MKFLALVFAVFGIATWAAAGSLSDCVAGVVNLQKQYDSKLTEQNAEGVAALACSSGGQTETTVNCLKGFTGKTKTGWAIAARACSGGATAASALKCFLRAKPNMENSDEGAANICSFGTNGDKAVACTNSMAAGGIGWQWAQYACRGDNDGDRAQQCIYSERLNLAKSWELAAATCAFGADTKKIEACDQAILQKFPDQNTVNWEGFACAGGSDPKTVQDCLTAVSKSLGTASDLGKACAFGNTAQKAGACVGDMKSRFPQMDAADVAVACQNYPWKGDQAGAPSGGSTQTDRPGIH